MVYAILVRNAYLWQCLSFETISYALIDSFVVKQMTYLRHRGYKA